MSDRLTSADVAFLYLEQASTPQHVGGLAIFDAPDGFDYDRLVTLLEERISRAPRYRQRLRAVPGRLANPVWVDDPDFDITYHVRRSALPRPGTEQALLEFAARIQSRLLDRSRPLWEMYLVEGLSDGRVAVITKTHPSMVDGRSGIDITEVLLDASPHPRRSVEPIWLPERERASWHLLADAVVDAARRPALLADAVRLSVRDARSTVGWLTGTVGGVVSAFDRTARGRHRSPLHTRLGQHRRLAIARTDLDDFRAVRAARGGTVNDAMLTVVTGVLRSWLLERGEELTNSTTVRALVPVSVQDESEVSTWTSAGRVAGLLVDLPVGEPDPVRRLARVQFAMAAHASSGPVSADALVTLSGFAPPTLLSLGARAAHGLTRRMYSIAVTNVPGPQLPLYAAGTRMTEMFPILPLHDGQALSIAMMSYDGGVFFGLQGDRDAVPDLDVLAASVPRVLAELVAASRPADIEPGRRRRPRSESRR